MTVYFVRHTEINRITSRLSEFGIRTAHMTGDFLRKQKITPSRVMCAPAPRCQETAEIIAGELGYEHAQTTADYLENWDHVDHRDTAVKHFVEDLVDQSIYVSHQPTIMGMMRLIAGKDMTYDISCVHGCVYKLEFENHVLERVTMIYP